jgi:hypothetical protein
MKRFTSVLSTGFASLAVAFLVLSLLAAPPGAARADGGTGGLGDPCGENGDCADGYVCANSVCTAYQASCPNPTENNCACATPYGATRCVNGNYKCKDNNGFCICYWSQLNNRCYCTTGGPAGTQPECGPSG